MVVRCGVVIVCPVYKEPTTLMTNYGRLIYNETLKSEWGTREPQAYHLILMRNIPDFQGSK